MIKNNLLLFAFIVAEIGVAYHGFLCMTLVERSSGFALLMFVDIIFFVASSVCFGKVLMDRSWPKKDRGPTQF